MRSRSLFSALCLLATLAAVACGTEDDSATGPTAGSSGKGNAGSSGKGNAGSSGKGNAGSESGGADNAGSAGSDGGAAGESGIPVPGCTHLSEFVHSAIKDDTNATSAPKPVNDLVFCDDPADPAAYDDLF